MNRSHGATLLITVFALAVLGLAASTLYTAHPGTVHQGSSPDSSNRSQMGQTSGSQPRSGGRAVHLFAFPDINVERSLNRPGQSRNTIQRLAIGFLLLIFAAILVIRHLTSDDPHSEIPADEATDTIDNKCASSTPSVPASAPPPTNGVYRAWRAMITSLDIPWENQDTPTELARKAIRDGSPETPVTELTGLFCSVRYGGKPPTDEREQCAQDALNQIQQSDHALDRVQQTDRSNDAESTTPRSER
jgi:hypothetical protein